MFKLSEETIQSLNRFQQSLGEVSKNISEVLSVFRNVLQEIDFQEISKTLILFAQVFKNLPENQKLVVDELTKCAWYMNSKNDMHMIGEILNLDKSNPQYIENIDKIMINYLKEHEDENYEWIVSSFKNRKSILLDALEEHKIGRYNCSIPVFLNQIDGITRDLLGIDKYNNFFKKIPEKVMDSSGQKVKTGKVQPYTKEIANDLSKTIVNDDGFIYSFVIYPLEKLSCLCYDSDDINKYIEDGTIYCNFSRHGIIHGKDLNYGTEVNSYKCISILLYLCTIKEILLDRNEVN